MDADRDRHTHCARIVTTAIKRVNQQIEQSFMEKLYACKEP